MEDTKYFSRSWALLTRDKGWVKPLLVMTAAELVPVAGSLGNKGYVLEWARLTAWGVDSAPKQRNVDVGGCIASGWRGFVVELGWGIVLGIAIAFASTILYSLPGVLGALLGGLFGLVSIGIGACSSTVMAIAEIRAAIYERIGAGYNVSRIFEMVGRDTSGFGRVFLVHLACAAVAGLAGSVAALVVAAMLMPMIMVGAAGGSREQVLGVLAASMGLIFVLVVVLILLFSFVGNMVRMITTTATALWMRQFDVPSWGRSEEPLPNTPPSVPAPESERPVADNSQARPAAAAVSHPTKEQPSREEEPMPREQQIADEEVTSQVNRVPLREASDPEPAVAESVELPIEAAAEPELEPEPEPAVEANPDPDPEPEATSGSEAEERDLKDVDELYAELYDVIQRNNHVDDE